MKFSEVGVARALRVYAAINHQLGLDGPKHDKPFTEDRVWTTWEQLRKHQERCAQGKCTYTIAAMRRLEEREESSRRVLVEIGDMLRTAGYGDGHIIGCVQRLIEDNRRAHPHTP